MWKNNEIHYLTTIAFDVQSNELYFWVDIGRIVRPLIIVYNNEEEFNKSNKKITFKLGELFSKSSFQLHFTYTIQLCNF